MKILGSNKMPEGEEEEEEKEEEEEQPAHHQQPRTPTHPGTT